MAVSEEDLRSGSTKSYYKYGCVDISSPQGEGSPQGVASAERNRYLPSARNGVWKSSGAADLAKDDTKLQEGVSTSINGVTLFG